MLRVNEFRFYDLAVRLYPLKLLEVNSRYKDTYFDLWNARMSLLALRSDPVPFRICRPSLDLLIGEINKIVPDLWSEATHKLRTAGENPIGHVAYGISLGVTRLETVMSEECQAIDTYFVSQKGAYATSDLVERSEIVFPESLRNRLQGKTVADIRAAGRCLAFDNPTAAGFHILRAIESEMSQYFHRVTGKSLPTRMRNWGIYLNSLRKADGHDPKVVEFLDQIRTSYRNPITHPEVNLESDEAEVLLGVAVAAIRQMILATATDAGL